MAKLKAAGCAPARYTTGWQSWVQLESFSAWHNVPFATKENGFAGNDPKLVFNGPVQIAPHREHAGLDQEGLFRLRRPQERARSEVLQRRVRDDDDVVGRLRHDQAATRSSSSPCRRCRTTPTSPGAPQNTIIGGASLWVMAGKKPEEYKGVAKFLTFLSQPDVQAEWHQATGYLPITMAAYELTKKSGFYEKNPGTDVSVEQMIVKTTNNSRGVRARQLRADPRRDRRGARGRLGGQEDGEGRRSTTR